MATTFVFNLIEGRGKKLQKILPCLCDGCVLPKLSFSHKNLKDIWLLYDLYDYYNLYECVFNSIDFPWNFRIMYIVYIEKIYWQHSSFLGGDISYECLLCGFNYLTKKDEGVFWTKEDTITHYRYKSSTTSWKKYV